MQKGQTGSGRKIVEVIKINTTYSNNYLVNYQGAFLLVDCSCSVDDVVKYTPKLDAIVITHGHYDHFYTLERVQKHFDCPVFMHQNAFKKLSNPQLNASCYFSDDVVCNLSADKVCMLKEGSNVVSSIPLEIMFSFGHTDDSILILIENNLFVGDFMFENGYGRTDLPTGSTTEMYKNLRKYLPLRKNYNMFYGHDE